MLTDRIYILKIAALSDRSASLLSVWGIAQPCTATRLGYGTSMLPFPRTIKTDSIQHTVEMDHRVTVMEDDVLTILGNKKVVLPDGNNPQVEGAAAPLVDGSYFALLKQVSTLESENAALTLELNECKEDVVVYAEVAREMEDGYTTLIAKNEEVDRRAKAAEEAAQDALARLADAEAAIEELRAQQIQASQPALVPKLEPVCKQRRDMIESPDATWAVMRGAVMAVSFALSVSLNQAWHQSFFQLLCENGQALMLVFAISFAGFICLFSLAEAWHCWHECTKRNRKQCTRSKMASAEFIQVGVHRGEISVPERRPTFTVFPTSRSRDASRPTPQAELRQIKKSQSCDSLIQRKPIHSCLKEPPIASCRWKSEPLIRVSSVATAEQYKRKARDTDADSARLPVSMAMPRVKSESHVADSNLNHYRRKTRIADSDRARLPDSVALAARQVQHQRLSVESVISDEVSCQSPRSPLRSSHKTSSANFYANVVHRQQLAASRQSSVHYTHSF